MSIWKYVIKSNFGTIITKNYKYAEEKSKSGYVVFCKKENTINKFYHF